MKWFLEYIYWWGTADIHNIKVINRGIGRNYKEAASVVFASESESENENENENESESESD